MKKYILILLSMLFLYSFNAIGQPTFSKYFDNSRFSDIAIDILPLDSEGYLFPIHSVDFQSIDTFTYARTYLVYTKLDIAGDTIWKKVIRIPYHNVELKIAKKFNNGYLLFGDIFDLVKYHNDTVGSFVFVSHIKSTGDTLWTKMIDIQPGNEFCKQVIQTADKGYAIIGASCNFQNENCDYFLMKLDSNANHKWTQRYSFSGNTFEDGNSLIQTEDKGFMLLGYSSAPPNDNRSFYLVKTDSAGNKQWDKRLFNFGGGKTGMSIIKLQDGNLLLSGITRTIAPGTHDGYVYKVDTNGNVIWEREFGGTKYDNFDKAVELNDGSIILAGNTESYNNRVNDGDGWLFKITSKGDSVWQRVFDTWRPSSTTTTADHFYGITKVNGGAVIIAFGKDTMINNPTQDAWILKVDSFGCLTPGCQMVGIDRTPLQIIPISIYPNPAIDEIVISHQLAVVSYKIYNALGVLVQQGEFTGAIHVKTLPSGNYFVVAELENDRRASGRFFKE